MNTRHGPRRLAVSAARVVAAVAVTAGALGVVATVLPATAQAAPAALAAPSGSSGLAVSPSTKPEAIPSDTTDVTVAMTENNGHDLIAYSPGGVSAPGVTDAPAVLFHQTGGRWTVYDGTGCAGPTWHQVLTAQAEPVASPVTVSEPLQICIGGGNTTLDGTLTALYNSTGTARTVNTLPLEEYVADTVPGESPSSWGTLGGPGPQGRDWGFQELEAQAVAVRSYVLANLDGYGGYADTCDLSCQTYRGTEYVSPASIAAANDTAGEVMYMPDGEIATTEYSASTGGYTSSAAQGSPFTPVPDAGDAVCVTGACNPNHDWTATVTAAAIEAQWGTIGTFTGIGGVVTDGGFDPDESYGRVNSLIVEGTAGDASVTGPEFADDLGLLSDFFHVTAATGSGVTLAGHGWGHGIGMGQWGALGYSIGQDTGQGPWTYQQIVDHYYEPATLGNLSGPPTSVGASGGIGGYWLVAVDGGIFSFGNAHFYGSMGGRPLNAPIVGMTATSDSRGYWEDASDGGIFSFGDAPFYGSMGGRPLNQPIVGMAAAADGGGYWEVAADGGIFSFGDAHFYGSMGGRPLNQPIVGMAATPDGGGYWEVAADGGIFSFGDAHFYGSTGSIQLARPVVGMAPTPAGTGYWLVAADGGVFAFGDATFSGSAAGTTAGQGTATIVPSGTGQGYLVVTSTGRVNAYGDAPQLGDLTTAVPGYDGDVVAAVATPG